MDDPALASFPLPLVTALLCWVIAVLVWRMDLGTKRASAAFTMLFGLCGVEAMLVGIRFGYGIEDLIVVQRTLPLFLGPLIYLGFAALSVGRRRFRRTVALHIGAPVVLMILFRLFVDDLRHLDWAISASYLIYTSALYRLWRKGPDALVHARVEIARGLSDWALRGIGLLVFILVLDSVIALDFALNGGAHVGALISYGTIPLIVILIAVLITLPAVLARPRVKTPPVLTADQQDTEVEAKLRNLLITDRLFLDPDLTVQRLARRLHIPARAVSAAINKTQGMNVSQYVNDFRLAHAADLLTCGDASVTKVATQSGFMTRSNFYREFQRVYGQSPTDYRTANRPAD